MVLFLFVLVGIVTIIGSNCQAVSSSYCSESCQFTVNNAQYDLTQLCDVNGTGFSFTAQEIGKSYQVNICGTLASECPATSSVCTAAPDYLCALVSSKGSLRSNEPSAVMAKEYDWELPCGATPQEQEVQHCEQCQVLARGGQVQAATELPVVNNVPGGLQLTFAPEPYTKAQLEHPISSSCATGPFLTLKVNCVCEKLDSVMSLHLSPSSPCGYTMSIASPHGCPTGYCTSPTDWGHNRSPSSSGGVSPGMEQTGGMGGFLLNAFFLVLVGYLVIACWFHYRDVGRLGLPDEHLQTLASVVENTQLVLSGIVAKLGLRRRTGQRFTTLDEEIPVNSVAHESDDVRSGAFGSAAAGQAPLYDEDDM